MTGLYLGINAILYLGLALWCMILPEKTSAALGFNLVSSSGRSEYLVVYGGMQLGFAVFFALCAMKTGWQYQGIVFACCLYVPILLCRAASFLFFKGIGGVTVATAGLEVVLTLWGLWLLRGFIASDQV